MKTTAFSSHTLSPSFLLKWTYLLAGTGFLTGSVVAFFLWALDVMTRVRWQHPWLLWLLPLAGVGIVFLYRCMKPLDRGNKLIIEQIHEPGGGVPRRMAPLVLFSSLATHLFGGSAGREGTAVQIGGCIAEGFTAGVKLSRDEYRALLVCGMAAGFGAVFGTPVTGALFALEVVGFRRVRWHWLVPCLLVSHLADRWGGFVGIRHTHYAIAGAALLPQLPAFAMMGLLSAMVAGLFIQLGHLLRTWMERLVGRWWWLRPVLGAAAIIALTQALGTRDYLGLGVTTAGGDGVSIVRAFKAGGAEPLSWFWKLLFTAITLSAGFKGGEVTPLFFMGATMGSACAPILGLPADLAAGLGFIAVFAAATRTPIACIAMGIELFGPQHGVAFAVACLVAAIIPAE
ncbi:MAG TPA: chloride channel protein [Candidatus Sumerlaeota bacterium]|nr:chloride channel protein [Candidatus Sumerlaeota bacterium]